MDCRDARTSFSPFYDGELSGSPLREEFLRHLGGCAECRREYDIFVRSVEVLRKEGMVSASPSFKPSLMAKIRSIVMRREAAGRGATERSAIRRSRAPSWLLPMAAAVAIVIVGGLVVMVLMGRAEIDRINSARRSGDALKPDGSSSVDDEKLFAMLMKEKGFERVRGMWLRADDARKAREGWVLDEGTWKRRDAVVGNAPADQRAVEKVLAENGFVPHGGTWISREMKERIDGGWVMVDGRWIARKDLQEKLFDEAGYVNVGGKWVARGDSVNKQPLVAKEPPASPLLHASLSEPLLDGLLRGVTVGEPVSYQGMTLFPLRRADTGKGSSWVTLADADRQRTVVIVEDARGSACEIVNQGESLLFCSAGEVVSGTADDWVLADDAVVPPKDSRRVRVRGLIAGNPEVVNNGSPRGAGVAVTPAMQRMLAQDAWRPQLWSHAARIGSLIDGSRGRGYVDLFAGNELRGVVSAYREGLANIGGEQTVGLVAMSGEDVLFFEIFSDSDLCRRRLDDIIAGVAIDHELARRSLKSRAAAAPSIKDLQKIARNLLSKVSVGAGTGESASLLWESRKIGIVGRSGVATPVHARLFCESDFWERIDGHVVYPVAPARYAGVMDEYREIMKSGSTAKRMRTIEDLACIDASAVSDLLIENLHHGEEVVRAASAQAIGLRKDPKSAAALTNELKKTRGKPQEFKYIVKALGALGSEQAVEPLIGILGACDYETARVVVEELPVVFVRLDNRRLLEEAMNRLVDYQERIQGGSNPMAGMTPYQQAALFEGIQKTLKAVTLQDFRSPVDYRRWWKSNGDKFLLQRGDENDRQPVFR